MVNGTTTSELLGLVDLSLLQLIIISNETNKNILKV